MNKTDNKCKPDDLAPHRGMVARVPEGWLRPNLIAGLTAAAVVIPKAMAYATIVGLPLQVGLYTVLVPMVIYALLGTSRPLSVSTTRMRRAQRMTDVASISFEPFRSPVPFP